MSDTPKAKRPSWPERPFDPKCSARVAIDPTVTKLVQRRAHDWDERNANWRTVAAMLMNEGVPYPNHARLTVADIRQVLTLADGWTGQTTDPITTKIETVDPPPPAGDNDSPLPLKKVDKAVLSAVDILTKASDTASIEAICNTISVNWQSCPNGSTTIKGAVKRLRDKGLADYLCGKKDGLFLTDSGSREVQKLTPTRL